jgi:hypothetical protein
VQSLGEGKKTYTFRELKDRLVGEDTEESSEKA